MTQTAGIFPISCWVRIFAHFAHVRLRRISLRITFWSFKIQSASSNNSGQSLLPHAQYSYVLSGLSEMWRGDRMKLLWNALMVLQSLRAELHGQLCHLFRCLDSLSPRLQLLRIVYLRSSLSSSSSVNTRSISVRGPALSASMVSAAPAGILIGFPPDVSSEVPCQVCCQICIWWGSYNVYNREEFTFALLPTFLFLKTLHNPIWRSMFWVIKRRRILCPQHIFSSIRRQFR